MPTTPSKPPNLIYQLKITLCDFKPPIWRRVLVPGKFNLYKLHQVIQIAMGWTNSHLHHFRVGEIYYSYPYPDTDWEDSGEVDSRRVTLAEIAPNTKSKFFYEYDFGDSWGHDILVEKIMPAEPRVKYPQCVQGKGACPPEDIGGVWGYADRLEAIRNPNHLEHEIYEDWRDGDFDPTAFDVEATDQALRQVKY